MDNKLSAKDQLRIEQLMMLLRKMSVVKENVHTGVMIYLWTGKYSY